MVIVGEIKKCNIWKGDIKGNDAAGKKCFAKNDVRNANDTAIKCSKSCKDDGKCKAWSFTAVNKKCKLFYHKQKGTGNTPRDQ